MNDFEMRLIAAVERIALALERSLPVLTTLSPKQQAGQSFPSSEPVAIGVADQTSRTEAP